MFILEKFVVVSISPFDVARLTTIATSSDCH